MEGGLCISDQGVKFRTGAGEGGYISWSVGTECFKAGDVGEDGKKTIDPGFSQSNARNFT